MDTQSIEILGRNRLINELIEAGIEVAQPIRDRGIDLIAYLDRDKKTRKFIAVPIQMKAASSRSFTIDKKYSKTSNLIIAYVWEVQARKNRGIFGLTYVEVKGVAKKNGLVENRTLGDVAHIRQQPEQEIVRTPQALRDDPQELA